MATTQDSAPSSPINSSPHHSSAQQHQRPSHPASSGSNHGNSSWKKMLKIGGRKSSTGSQLSSSTHSHVASPTDGASSSGDLFAPSASSSSAPLPQPLYSTSPNLSSSGFDTPKSNGGYSSSTTLDSASGRDGYFAPHYANGATAVSSSQSHLVHSPGEFGMSSPSGSTKSWSTNGTGKENLRSTKSLGRSSTRVGGGDKQRGPTASPAGRGGGSGTGSPVVPQSASPTQTSFRSPPSPGGPIPSGSSGSSATRFLRRVASAPNTKALFSGSFFSSSSAYSSTKNGYLSPTSTTTPPVPPIPVGPLPVADIHDSGVSFGSSSPSPPKHNTRQAKQTPKSSLSDATKSSSGSNRSSAAANSRNGRGTSPARSYSSPSLPKSPSFTPSPSLSHSSLLSPPSPNASIIGPNGSPRMAFRRTYSSSSIRVRNVEIGPSSFHKIKVCVTALLNFRPP